MPSEVKRSDYGTDPHCCPIVKGIDSSAVYFFTSDVRLEQIIINP